MRELSPKSPSSRWMASLSRFSVSSHRLLLPKFSTKHPYGHLSKLVSNLNVVEASLRLFYNCFHSTVNLERVSLLQLLIGSMIHLIHTTYVRVFMHRSLKTALRWKPPEGFQQSSSRQSSVIWHSLLSFAHFCCVNSHSSSMTCAFASRKNFAILIFFLVKS